MHEVSRSHSTAHHTR